MKKRWPFWTLLLALIGLGCWWLLHYLASLPTSHSSVNPGVPPNISQDVYPSPVELAAFLNAPERTAAEKEAFQKNPGLALKYMTYLAMRAAGNAADLTFYGKVVDQYGQPVVGARILGRTLLYVSMDASGGDSYYTDSDADGLFKFVGIHGASLTVTPQKAGYEYNPRLPPNWTENYVPDPANPMVFTMWKTQGAELLIQDEKFYGLNPDGRTNTIDLVKGIATGRPIPEGDLQVSIQRPAGNNLRGKFDWSFSIEILGGGLVEAPDSYLNLAPENGYQPKYTFTMSASDPNWQEELQDKIFYIKSREGKIYGYIKITAIPNYNDTSALDIKSFVNPAGSRNLEQDPKMVIRAGSPDAKLTSTN